MYCDPHLLPTLIKALATAQVQHLIYNSEGEVKQDDINNLKSRFEHLTILSFEQLRQLGHDNPMDPIPPEPEDLCCIMYTSGSTGSPKGVPVKHKAVLAASELFRHISTT